MANGDFKCVEHTGCVSRIDEVERQTGRQWETLDSHREKLDGIMSRINVVLGGIVIACIMLVVNLAIK